MISVSFVSLFVRRYSDTNHEVGWLQCCLDAVRVALEALERDTTATHAVDTNAHAHVMGKDALRLVVLFVIRRL